MRVALVNNYYYLKGGAERVLFEQQKLLEARGHQVAVFAQAHRRNAVSAYGHTFSPFKDWRGCRGLSKVAMALRIMYDRRTAEGFARFLEAVEPDIVHAHNIYGGLTTSVLDVARKKGVPVVMTLHDYKLICPAYLMLNRGVVCEDCRGGRFIHCLLNACHKESLTASGVYCLESYLNRWLHKYQAIRYFICPSRFSLRLHADHGIRPDRLRYIPNFVNAAEFEPHYDNGRYALFVGRLSKEKGIGALLAAVRDLDVPARIVGDGPLKAHYEGLAKEQGMTHVRFEGYRSGEDLKRLYANAAFLVIPSQWYENAPMTILEAYASGKPVIGSRTGGIAEMIESGRTGLLFDPQDVGALSACIQNLWSDRSARRQMGRAARQRLQRRYSDQVHYGQLMALYSGLLSCGGAVSVPEVAENRSTVATTGVGQRI